MRALNGQDLSFATLPFTPENNVSVPGYSAPQDVNIINVPDIQQLVKGAFDPQPAVPPGAKAAAGKSTASPAPVPAASTVTVDVYNGNPEAAGLAAQVSQALVALGYKAGAVENASAQSQTVAAGRRRSSTARARRRTRSKSRSSSAPPPPRWHAARRITWRC